MSILPYLICNLGFLNLHPIRLLSWPPPLSFSSHSFLLLCFLACSLVWQESAVNRREGRREEKEPWVHNRNQRGAYGTETQQCCHVRRPAEKGTEDWMCTSTAVIIMTVTVMGLKHDCELTFLILKKKKKRTINTDHTHPDILHPRTALHWHWYEIWSEHLTKTINKYRESCLFDFVEPTVLILILVQ